MATGSDLSKTLKGGHEIVYDFPCSLCENEGRHAEAAIYCEECFVYMCDPCVKSHNRIPLIRRHKQLDKGQFTTVGQSVLKSFPTKRCLKHPGELVNIFCGNHDVVCCSVCKALDHSNCNKTQHLPDAAKGIKRSTEYQNIRKETKVFLSALNNLLDDRKADRFRIDKEKQQVKRTIADFRKKANKYLDDLEQKSLNELNLRESSITKTLEQDRKWLDKTKKEAEDILKQFDAFRGDNECELFFQVNACKSFVHESMKIVEDISSPAPLSIVFNIDANIQQYLSAVITLGRFDDTCSSAAKPFSVASGSSSAQPQNTKVTTDHAHQTLTEDASGHLRYKTHLFGYFGVKESTDTNKCYILDICQLPDGNILITDCESSKLMRLDQSYKLLDSIQLPGPLYNVCAAGPGEAAVSLCDDKKVQFVSVKRNLSLTMSFTTGNFCRGMVYINDKLYVCCGDMYDSSSGYIEVYDSAGQLHHSLPRDSQCLSAVPRYITVTDDSQHLLVTSIDSYKISMLDLAGNVVITFNSKVQKPLSGICTDGRGHVFVSRDNTVVQFSPKHKMIQVILTEADGVLKPTGVYFDKRMSRLLIACSDSNYLLAYSLTMT